MKILRTELIFRDNELLHGYKIKKTTNGILIGLIIDDEYAIKYSPIQKAIKRLSAL